MIKRKMIEIIFFEIVHLNGKTKYSLKGQICWKFLKDCTTNRSQCFVAQPHTTTTIMILIKFPFLLINDIIHHLPRFISIHQQFFMFCGSTSHHCQSHFLMGNALYVYKEEDLSQEELYQKKWLVSFIKDLGYLEGWYSSRRV